MVMRPRSARWSLVAALAAGMLAATGCEIAEVTVAPPAPAVVVHAVLNPDALEQVILVEASLTGRVAINDNRDFNPLDPIRTAGGDPIANADVRLLTGSDTAGVRATETRIGTRGTGRYVVPRAMLAVQPGQSYRLRIRARTYAVRVESPYGPWALFSDSTRFALDGRLRNFLAPGLPSVFLPGFRQTGSIVAVDRNFYDYNRSGNDPFGGTGLISSVQGGIGLFASVLELQRFELSVLQQDRAPIDAGWRGVTTTGTDVLFDLWLETPGPRFSALSGRRRTPEQFIVGTLADDGTAHLPPDESLIGRHGAGAWSPGTRGA